MFSPDLLPATRSAPPAYPLVSEPADLSQIFVRQPIEKLQPGEAVFCEADPATDLVQVTEGCLRRYRILPDGRRAITGFAFPGDVLGSASPGVVVYKGYKETETGVLLETFPLSGTQLSPADASSFFRLDWEDLKGLMSRLNVSGTN